MRIPFILFFEAFIVSEIYGALLRQLSSSRTSGVPIVGQLGGRKRSGGGLSENETFYRFRKGVTENEVDCSETYFMYPFRTPQRFSAKSSDIQKRREQHYCHYTFIGTEPCVPKLNCDVFNLAPTNKKGKCKDEYIEVVDGNTGKKKYCGTKPPKNVVAASGMRDLYIKYKIKKRVKLSDENSRFNCYVSCSQRGEGKPLEETCELRVNENCYCGIKPKTDKIVNGANAKRGEFPWIVALVETGTRQPFCGGSILNDRVVITAAHCFKGKYLDINNVELMINEEVLDTTPNSNVVQGPIIPKVYKKSDLDKMDKANNSVRATIDEVILHPLYVTETNDFDVALLILSEPLNFRRLKAVNPICLPDMGSYMRTFANRKATVAGWGLPGSNATHTMSRIQKLDVNVFPPKECKEFYAHRVNRRMMCAGYKDGGADSCMGDSGGPLVSEDHKEAWTLIGTVSWGEGCATPLNPGVFIRTTETSQWANYHSNQRKAIWCNCPP